MPVSWIGRWPKDYGVFCGFRWPSERRRLVHERIGYMQILRQQVVWPRFTKRKMRLVHSQMERFVSLDFEKSTSSWASVAELLRLLFGRTSASSVFA